ncbi:MAG: response regulator [Isosphaeraceae bacterium]
MIGGGAGVTQARGVVLIVDDSADDRALLRTILVRAGYSVVEAERGSDALARAAEFRPHLIVLDLNLPDVDGLEVCRSIRADRQVANVPVLMLTVRHDDADVVAGLNAGADDYVPKDAAPELILARVERLIQYRQLAGLAMLNRQLVQVGRLLTGIIHEIRGPLSVIRGSAELLRLNLQPDQVELQWVDSILRGTQLLQVRLEHLMAAVRSGPAQVRPLDLCLLLREAIDLFVKGLPPLERGIRVHAAFDDSGVCVRADPGRMIQVLIDLLNNAHQAISAVRKSGRIELRVEQDPETVAEGWVRILVIDDGPGIPEIYLDRLFEPFFTTRDQGTGYGLYLAGEILKEQGGRLEACNDQGGGACFTIWLPRATAS